MKIKNSNGWTEPIIVEKCVQNDLNLIVDLIEQEFDIIIKKAYDIKSNYIDFIHKTKVYTLNFNEFIGISLFPKSLTNSTNLENKIVLNIANSVFENLNSKPSKNA